MAPQYIFDKVLADGTIDGRRLAGTVAQYNEILHAESGDQLGARPLRQQRPFGIGHFDNQQAVRSGLFTQSPDMLGEQRVEVTGQPGSRLGTLSRLRFFERNDFRSRVQDA